MKTGEKVTLTNEGLQQLLENLSKSGYLVRGPKKQGNAIIYDEISSVEDLPAGWTDEQEKGGYALKRRGDDSLFGFASGPMPWKRFLHPPEVVLWKARRKGYGFEIINVPQPEEKFAFIGVRPCDLNAILIQDKVFIHGTFVNRHYKVLRENAFIVAVNCTSAGNTCFCASMDAGPEVKSGYDLALTEVSVPGSHYFVCEAGTEAGLSFLQQLEPSLSTQTELDQAREGLERAVGQMGRKLDTDGVKEKLADSYDHEHWDEVAGRCLTCTNCTMVCPTCFCTTVEEVTDLAGENSDRTRRWDSCFTFQYTYIHGSTVRKSAKSRYRQWLTHKFSTWYDQFGTAGCTGCGRCITWCPAGIDVTEEIVKITKDKEKVS